MKKLLVKGFIGGLASRGNVKIGRKGAMKISKNGVQYQTPEKLEHFLITTLERDKENNFLKDISVHEKFGETPKEIPILFLFNDIALNLQSRLACYYGSTLYCSGDGEMAEQLTKERTRMKTDCPCHRFDPEFTGDDNNGKGKCKINMCLSFIIDGVDAIGGVYKFRSTSYNTYTSLLSALIYIRSLTGGNLANIPMFLVMTPKTVVNPVDGKTQKIWVVSVEYRGKIETLRSIALQNHQRALEFKQQIGVMEEEVKSHINVEQDLIENADDISAEFYPEVDPEKESATVQKPAANQKKKDTPPTAAPQVGEQKTVEENPEVPKCFPEVDMSNEIPIVKELLVDTDNTVPKHPTVTTTIVPPQQKRKAPF